MGVVVDLSGPALNMYLYGDKSNIVGDYIRNQMNGFIPACTEFGNRIYESMVNSYNFITDNLTRMSILSELNSQNLTIMDIYIRELLTYQDMINADISMQRWVMAHPEVVKLYDEQNIDGYSSTYVVDNMDRSYDYRMATDAMLMDEDDYWTVKYNNDDLLDGDKQLTFSDKVNIAHTYDAISHMIKNSNIDFTLKSDKPKKRNS